MMESFLQSVLGLVLAAALFVAALPVFNGLTGFAVTWRVLLDPVVAGALVGTTLLVALLAGAYPAVMISSFSPVSGLRGERDAGGGKSLLRRGLVVFQFAASIFLIAASVVIWQQLEYVRTADVGFDREGVLTVRISNGLSDMIRENPMTLRRALTAHSEIVAVSHASDIPGERYSMEGMRLVGASTEDEQLMRVAWTSDHDYVEALGLELVEGRGFSREAPADTNAWVINEAAARRLGLKPGSATGEVLRWDNYAGPIVGVVKDFNIASFHRQVEPLVIPLRPGYGNYLIVRYSGNPAGSLIPDIESTIEEYAPAEQIEYSFLDDRMDALYRQESKMQAIISWFSAIAVFVACLGLFGLAAYAVTRRTTEIGVRKVLGASIPQVMALVTREFVVLVGVAFVVATPITYVAVSRWLDTFAYRVGLSVWPFVGAGLLALVFAVLTVGGHALRAASLNPVTAIKRE
jgi:putative ABC transport system permease protein